MTFYTEVTIVIQEPNGLILNPLQLFSFVTDNSCLLIFMNFSQILSYQEMS